MRLRNHMVVIYGLPVRACAKTGCSQEAVATAALRYRERILLVGDLVPSRDPNLFDLCQGHAVRVTAPYGWRRIDGRTTTLPGAPAGA
jgi:hypothetical protein